MNFYVYGYFEPDSNVPFYVLACLKRRRKSANGYEWEYA